MEKAGVKTQSSLLRGRGRRLGQPVEDERLATGVEQLAHNGEVLAAVRAMRVKAYEETD